MGAAFGRFVWRVSARQRRVTRENLVYAYGGALEPAARDAVGRASFESMGKTIFEFMQFPRLTSSDILHKVRFVNLEAMDRALAKGRGVIAATAHLSNWEFFAAAFAASGRPLAVVVRPLDNKRLDAWVENFRASKGMEVVPRGAALRSGLSALKKGKVLAFLMDQNAARNGVFAPFFGRLAATAGGPAAFAVKRNIPLVFCYARREEDDIFSLVFHEETELPLSGSEEEKIEAVTAQLNAKIEAAVRERPGEWLWMHPRWRTQYRYAAEEAGVS
jgi:KDO2-lipid IV(A) lauroyltransferase